MSDKSFAEMMEEHGQDCRINELLRAQIFAQRKFLEAQTVDEEFAWIRLDAYLTGRRVELGDYPDETPGDGKIGD